MIFWPLLIGLGLLGGTALWVHFGWRGAAGLGLALAGCIGIWAVTDHGLAALLACLVAVALWYLSLRPRLDRDWAPDVARIVTGEVTGTQVALHDLRAFRWTSTTEASPHWIDMTVDLDQLCGADMITSVWGNPKIAHLLVSFAFTTGQRVVFSVEIRRERGEEFSSIGGFFRQFELALIGATEDDIVALRTDHRHEDVRRYALLLAPAQLRPVFLAYLALGNRLARRARFYNTVTANCTTVVWHLVRAIDPRFGWHRSLLLSGLLPEWLHGKGLIGPPEPARLPPTDPPA